MSGRLLRSLVMPGSSAGHQNLCELVTLTRLAAFGRSAPSPIKGEGL
jgi:hypothetical protein